MTRNVKVEAQTIRGGEGMEEEARPAQRTNRGNARPSSRDEGAEVAGGGGGGGGGVETRQEVMERRVIRSRYLAVKNLINDEREDISKVDSDKFNSIIGQVEKLHLLVQKPREQVADAEALLDIANTLVTSVKSHSNDGLTPSDFITSLLRDHGQRTGQMSIENPRDTLVWRDIGITVSHVFMNVHGCCTMLGPMDTELKQRKVVVQRKRVRPTESARPEELDKNGVEEKTDTDKNMSTMFNILRKKRSVKLENLILNRKSFAQTVENIFALSFLVKDGRVEIAVTDDGHVVLPKNAPAANAVVSGDVSYTHFVFRMDYTDWKLMLGTVCNGEELMPHRTPNDSNDSREEEIPNSQAPTTPIRKLCRNRGLVTQEQSVVEDSPEDNTTSETSTAAAIRKGKRKLI